MKMNIVKYLILFAMMGSTQSAVSEPTFSTPHQADLPKQAMEVTVNKQGLFEFVLVSSWTDRIKVEGEQVYRKYTQGYDYKKKQGFYRVHTLDGKLVDERYDVNISPGVAREEVLKAFDIVTADQQTQKSLNDVNAVIQLYGGFNFQDETSKSAIQKPDHSEPIVCGLGNRCVHVLASTLKDPNVGHAVIRLNDMKIVRSSFEEQRLQRKKHTENQTSGA